MKVIIYKKMAKNADGKKFPTWKLIYKEKYFDCWLDETLRGYKFPIECELVDGKYKVKKFKSKKDETKTYKRVSIFAEGLKDIVNVEFKSKTLDDFLED